MNQYSVKKIILLLTIILITAFTSQKSHALVEANAFGGVSFVTPGSLNKYLRSINVSDIFLVGVYGVEGTVFIPTTSLGLGLRTDYHGIKVANQGNELNVGVNRLSGVLKYRFFDSMIYLGPVAFIGISHSPKVDIKLGANTTSYDSGTSESGGGGLEAGFKLALLRLGFEAGFESYLTRDIKGASGNATFDINFGGFYALAELGLAF